MRSDSTIRAIWGVYSFDPQHSRIVARSTRSTKVRGSFTGVDGSAHFDLDFPANSHVDITVKSATIDTGDSLRDARLRSDRGLDVATHPVIAFVSTSVDRVDSNVFRAAGGLTMKGRMRPLIVDFELLYSGATVGPHRSQRVGLKGGATISCKDFGVSLEGGSPSTPGLYGVLDSGGLLVDGLVTLELDLSAIKTE